MKNIRLADFQRSLGSLELSPTRKLPIRRADMGTLQLAQELSERPSDMGLQLAVLKRVVPDITDEELRSLPIDVIKPVVDRAMTGIAEVESLLGESSGASPGGTTDSAPATPADTSAAESPPGTG